MFNVRWRRTDSNNWQNVQQVWNIVRSDQGPPNPCFIREELKQPKCDVSLKGVRVDDWVFGVSSVSKDGFESPVASAVPGGAFKPWVKPAEFK
jgi:hypothetical protein